METEGSHNVVVEATPRFAPEHSDPKQGRWIFIYRIRIENQSEGPIRVLVRHWEIVDADGDKNIIDDEGVVGCQPRLDPGETFEYESFCALPTEWGTMEGHYMAEDRYGQPMQVQIPRMHLHPSLLGGGFEEMEPWIGFTWLQIIFIASDRSSFWVHLTQLSIS